MKLNGITDVFFDLDHTLWDFDKNSGLTFNKVFKLNGINVDLELFLSHYEPINLNYWKLYREEKIQKEALRFNRLNDAFLAIDTHVDEHTILKLSEDYITHLSTFNHLLDNTLEILNYLRPNYNLHIITNGFQEVQHGKLINSKINDYFKTVTNSEMAGVKKPNPEIFDFALKVAHANVDQSIMIGDNYEADILGAINVGMDAIFLDVNSSQSDQNIKRVGNLYELKKYL